MLKKIVSLLSACVLAFGAAGYLPSVGVKAEAVRLGDICYPSDTDTEMNDKWSMITAAARCTNQNNSETYAALECHPNDDGQLIIDSKLLPYFERNTKISEIGVEIRGLPTEFNSYDVKISNAQLFTDTGRIIPLDSLNSMTELKSSKNGFAYIRLREEDLIDEQTGEIKYPATPELKNLDESIFVFGVTLQMTIDFGDPSSVGTILEIVPQTDTCAVDEIVYYDVYVRCKKNIDALQFNFDVKGGEIQGFGIVKDNLKKLGFDDWDFRGKLTNEQKEQLSDFEEYRFIGFDIDHNDSEELRPNERVKIGTLFVIADGTYDEVTVTTTSMDGIPNGYSSYDVDQSAAWTTVGGTVTLAAEIDEVDEYDISNYNIILSKISYNYDGKPKLPEFTVERGKNVLEKGKDYTVSVSDNTEVGTATITVTGKGDYKGTKQAHFIITETYIPGGDPCGNNLVWTFDENFGQLYIDGFGKMYDYDAGEAPWYDLRDKIINIVVTDGVTGIGNNAFSGCTNLISITLPETLTEIGDYAFYDAVKLREITFPEKLDSLGMYALTSTRWLEERQAEDPMVIVNGMLIDGTQCSGDIVIPDSVDKILGYAFSKNSRITSVVLPESVTKIGEKAFEKCTSLKTIDIPENVLHIYSDAFSGCSSELTILCVKGSPAERHAFDKKINYELKTISIEGCRIELTPSTYVFEGVPCEPMTDVWVDNVHLDRNIDYDVEYVNNDIAGLATVIITGKGSYSGKEMISFEISSPAKQIILGDINNDGSINVSDISMIAAHIKGKKSLEGDALTAADVSQDTVINVKDLSLVAAHVKGIKMLIS